MPDYSDSAEPALPPYSLAKPRAGSHDAFAPEAPGSGGTAAGPIAGVLEPVSSASAATRECTLPASGPWNMGQDTIDRPAVDHKESAMERSRETLPGGRSRRRCGQGRCRRQNDECVAAAAAGQRRTGPLGADTAR